MRSGENMKAEAVSITSDNIVKIGRFNFVVWGHWLYCRKCRTPDIKDANGIVRIVIPDKSKDSSNWLEVLAKGTKIGSQRSDDSRVLKTKKIRRWSTDDIKVGDMILCPENHPWGMPHSPFAPDGVEFFIDAEVPIAIGE